MFRTMFVVLFAWAIASPSPATAEGEITQEKAANALRRAVEFFRTEVSVDGGYLWRYSSDFSEREGELPASPTTAWVQPSGTPTVGMAYLTVSKLTGRRDCLDAARETALALVRGQLESGGWDYRIEFAEEDRKQYAYRVESAVLSNASVASRRQRNVTTLDDNTTQAALSFLMQVDHVLKFEDAAIHEAAEYALRKLLAAQYPNGAWPQRFSAPADPQQFPVKPAGYPPNWSREYPKKDYRSYYTFNDNTMADVIEMMFLAGEVYGDGRYTEAAKRGGTFILLAQLPGPQPGWAQQYNARMHPAWARKFEPPSTTGAESQRVMETLLRLFELTRDRRFLEPLPRALAYFRRSQLQDGCLARFYELETNRPLYFTKDYHMTYSDADLPTHYDFKSRNRLDEIESRFERLAATADSDVSRVRVFQKQPTPVLTKELARTAAKLVQTQDARGAWVEPAYFRARSKMPAGMPSLSCRTFAANIATLARYVAATSANASNN
jgi:PelA/Pel-15E family pectate lyase